MIRSGGVRNDLARTTNVVRAGRPKTGTAPNLGFRVARALGDDQFAVQATALDTASNAATQPAYAWPVDSEAGQLFAVNCAPCHTDPSSLKGVYGTDIETVRQLISEGGNNIMSMPAFNGRISADEIDLITDYVMQQKDWD
jgi:mono/diheme cytochrome c family protein